MTDSEVELDAITYEDTLDRETTEQISHAVQSTIGVRGLSDMNIGITRNSPPQSGWDSIIKVKFKSGDLVVYSSFNDDEHLGDVWGMKVIGPAKEIDSYFVRQSGSKDDMVIEGGKLKLAPDDAKWKSFIEENDPFNIPGLKVTVPSHKSGFLKG